MSEQENQELLEYRYKKALDTLDEVQDHILHKHWNTAVNRCYYACYYAVSALLAHIKVYPKSHSGLQQMFSLHFVKSNIFSNADSEFYQKLMDMRQDADYEDFVDYDEADVITLTQPARAFIDKVGAILFQK